MPRRSSRKARPPCWPSDRAPRQKKGNGVFAADVPRPSHELENASWIPRYREVARRVHHTIFEVAQWVSHTTNHRYASSEGQPDTQERSGTMNKYVSTRRGGAEQRRSARARLKAKTVGRNRARSTTHCSALCLSCSCSACLAGTILVDHVDEDGLFALEA
jgi:hypothetical protein